MLCRVWHLELQQPVEAETNVPTAFSLATIIGMRSHIAFTIISLNDV